MSWWNLAQEEDKRQGHPQSPGSASLMASFQTPQGEAVCAKMGYPKDIVLWGDRADTQKVGEHRTHHPSPAETFEE